MPGFAGSEVARTRSRVAVAARVGTPQQVEDARREHAAAKLKAYIEDVVDNAPPLTAEQRDKLALLLSGPRRQGGRV